MIEGKVRCEKVSPCFFRGERIMKRKISEYCIGKLLEYNEITDAEIDLYAYGIESVITM